MAKKISIAIDGPAGAGKSTIARRLAKEMGYMYVDTGAIYRTVAYFFDLWGIAPKDIDGITRYIDELTVNIKYDEDGLQHMIMNGMDVTDSIRTQEIGQKANYDQILKEIRQRDYQDTHREVAPLKMCRDSVKLDTSDMDIEQVIAEMKAIIGKKIPV